MPNNNKLVAVSHSLFRSLPLHQSIPPLHTHTSQGANGAPGGEGPPGIPGPMGPSGQQGLIGAPGVQGTTGLQGATGDPGSPGEPGNAGPQGAVGPPGQDGAQGLPVSYYLIIYTMHFCIYSLYFRATFPLTKALNKMWILL